MNRKKIEIYLFSFLWIARFLLMNTGCQRVKPEQVLFWEKNAIYRWDSMTDKTELIKTLPKDQSPIWVSLSPDQQKYLCLTELPKQGYTLWINQNTDQEWQKAEEISSDSYIQLPFWMKDSSGFLYSRYLHETQQGDFIYYASYELVRFDFSNNTPHLIQAFKSPPVSFVWSPDQKQAAFFANSGDKMMLWYYQTGSGKLAPLCSVEADHFSKNRIHWADNNRLIWLEMKLLNSWDLSNQKKEILVTMPEVVLSFDFYIPQSQIAMAYSVAEPSEKTICILYSWKEIRSQIIATGFRIDSLRFSPKGTSLLFFLQADKSQKPELVVFSIQNQQETPVCQVNKITIYPWDTNPTYAMWSPDEQELLMEDKQEDYSGIYFYRLRSPKSLKKIHQSEYVYAYSFSPKIQLVRILYPKEKQTMIAIYNLVKDKWKEFPGEWIGWVLQEQTP